MSTSRALSPIQQVCETIKQPEMQAQIKAALPDDVTIDKFTRVLLVALQNNPGLAEKDKISLYNSVVRCAADGLLPDGREAALVAYGDKVQYMPMVWGITKKLMQVGIAMSAECVYSNDDFEQALGDEAGIRHKAPKLGQDRGELVGVYAIARDFKTGRVLDREVMDKEAVEVVRSVSRNKNGDLWTKWITEAYRKTSIRRLSKRLHGVPDSVRGIIEADDEMVDLASAPVAPAPTGGRPRALAAVVAQAAPAPIEAESTVIDPPADDAVNLG